MSDVYELARLHHVVDALKGYVEIPETCVFLWIEWKLNQETNQQTCYCQWTERDDDPCGIEIEDRHKQDELYIKLSELFLMPLGADRVFLRAREGEIPTVESHSALMLKKG